MLSRRTFIKTLTLSAAGAAFFGLSACGKKQDDGGDGTNASDPSSSPALFKMSEKVACGDVELLVEDYIFDAVNERDVDLIIYMKVRSLAKEQLIVGAECFSLIAGEGYTYRDGTARFSAVAYDAAGSEYVHIDPLAEPYFCTLTFRVPVIIEQDTSMPIYLQPNPSYFNTDSPTLIRLR